jgi:hypothetical protein
MNTSDQTIEALVDAIIGVASTAQEAPLADLVRLSGAARQIADAACRLMALIDQETAKHLPAGFQLHPVIPCLAEDGKPWTAATWAKFSESLDKESAQSDLVDQQGRLVWLLNSWEWCHNTAWSDPPGTSFVEIDPPDGPLYPVTRIGEGKE